jgi:WD40 repeat protein
MMFSSAAVLPEGGYLFVGRATPTGAAHSDMLWMKTEPPARRAITPETADSLAEATRFDVGMHVFELVFLSDTRLAVADSERAAFWDLEAEEPLVEFSRSEIGRVIGMSPDRQLLAIYAPWQHLELWTVDPLERVTELCPVEDTEWPTAAFSANGCLLAVTNRWNDIEIWDLEERTRIHNCVGHHSNLFALTFSPDGRWLASGGGTSSRDDAGESFIGIWDVSTGDRLAWLPTEDLGDNHDLTFTHDDSRLISAGQRRMLAWDTSTWERTYDSGPSYPGSYGIALSPDGSLLAIATDARRIRLMNIEEMRSVRDIYTSAEVIDVDFSGDGTMLAASFVDGTVRIWEIP